MSEEDGFDGQMEKAIRRGKIFVWSKRKKSNGEK